MANEKIEALKEQLKVYNSKIDIYEKAFLANDGKIDAEEQKTLDSIRGMLTAINTKIQSKKPLNNSIKKTDPEKSLKDKTSEITPATKALKKGQEQEIITNIKANLSTIESLYQEIMNPIA
jgi:hypothetical protein